MRIIVTIAAAAALATTLGAVATAKTGNPTMKLCAANWKTTSHVSATYKTFMTSCLAKAPAGPANLPDVPTAAMVPASPGKTLATAPPKAAVTPPGAPTGAPAGATALCKDNTYSKTLHHADTCLRHGGVAKFLQ